MSCSSLSSGNAPVLADERNPLATKSPSRPGRGEVSELRSDPPIQAEEFDVRFQSISDFDDGDDCCCCRSVDQSRRRVESVRQSDPWRGPRIDMPRRYRQRRLRRSQTLANPGRKDQKDLDGSTPPQAECGLE